MKYLFTFISCLILIGNCFGQSDPKLPVFNFNPLHYNPAFAGSNGSFGVMAIHSSQFVGFEGAPQTSYLSIHGLLHEQNIGLGLDVMADRFDPSQEVAFNFNLSYRMRISSDWHFTFGAKGGLDRYYVDYSHLNILDPDEAVFASGDHSLVKPNLGAGFFLMNDSFFIGASAPNVTSRSIQDQFQTELSLNKTNYYFTTGYNYSIKPGLMMRNAVLVRMVEGAPHSSLYSVTFDHGHKMFLGVNYETRTSIGTLVGFNLEKNLKVGYAFDHPTNGLGRYTKGTHTLMLSLVLDDSKRRTILPCFYY